jgi:CMP-N,N'-diacetyllegionaminic acid synthase
MSQPNCIALITGRGGSKRLLGKHTRPLGGKPLIAWSIEAARNSAWITRTIVSTDSPRIAAAAASAGAEVPFLRPAELAADDVTNCDVMLHALDWLECHGRLLDMLCLCQATSPFRTAADLDSAIETFSSSNVESLLSVTSTTPPGHLLYIDQSGHAAPACPDPAQEQRLQELRPAYKPNGAIYLVRPDSFRRRRKILCDRPLAYVMPAMRSIDIDTADDLALAEALLGVEGALDA